MPRLPWSIIRRAWQENNLLPSLLRATRDLDSARLELKWLQEHVERSSDRGVKASIPAKDARIRLHRLVQARSRGVPLQYLLGTEYFGGLELLCEPGVLIPRWETAASVQYLLQRIPDFATKLSDEPHLLDLCTGTGCIPLLISAEYPYTQTTSNRLQVLGIDISRKALNLARRNRTKVLSDLCTISEETSASDDDDDAPAFATLRNMRFLQADVLAEETSIKSRQAKAIMSVLEDLGQTTWDIVTSNPPYISPRSFSTQTTRSVRNFEPKLALVPPSRPGLSDSEQGDTFYSSIERIARTVNAKILLVEVADMAQAERVVDIARKNAYWRSVEIWCDDPGARIHGKGITSTDHIGTRVRGAGNGRSVFCCSFEL